MRRPKLHRVERTAVRSSSRGEHLATCIQRSVDFPDGPCAVMPTRSRYAPVIEMDSTPGLAKFEPR